MEFVEGHDLSILVKENDPLPVSTAVDCTLYASMGLEYAHAEGIIHRDVKPSNLILTRSGEIKVLDMGLARVTSKSAGGNIATTQTQLTKTGAVMGTVDRRLLG